MKHKFVLQTATTFDVRMRKDIMQPLNNNITFYTKLKNRQELILKDKLCFGR